ncbi:HNH endonuclease [Candidatus Magnetobacterium bavaricum]|uniref:Putative HNH nuclease YajD n=1 Tax=Candidatus Magnetobacterium bavaricum TaxID=29290 RepID=A0A0F3GPF3_9BACT|nr:HNH endonuclease [Candidatus Magnetobacterium bavaricum]
MVQRRGSYKPKRSVKKPASDRPIEEIVRQFKASAQSESNSNYREESLRIHGLICAKCGREFGPKDRHLLTVHHKDGNHDNNPADGSNWENLCAYCHDDEHSRGILADYLRGR